MIKITEIKSKSLSDFLKEISAKKICISCKNKILSDINGVQQNSKT